MPHEDQRWFGGLLIVASAAAFSLAGFFTRLIAIRRAILGAHETWPEMSPEELLTDVH